MAVQPDPAVAGIDAAGLLDHRGETIDVVFVRKDDAFGREAALGIKAIQQLAFRFAPETQWMAGRDRLTLVVAVLIHEEEPAVCEGDAFALHHLGEEGILTHGAYRQNETRRFVTRITFLDFIRDIACKRVMKLVQALADAQMGVCLRCDLFGRE